MTVTAARDALTDLLATLLDRAAGYRVTDDPRNAQPPCVLVGPPRNPADQSYCGRHVDIPVRIMAVGPGNADALDWCLAGLDVLLDADGITVTDFQPVVDAVGAPTSAYELTCLVTT